MAATTALREALNLGISSGNLVDTKIILYSRRNSSSQVCKPKPLYANSHVLKTVPYFNDLFFGNFAEAQPRDFKEAIDKEETTEDYGYLSDSDLEDDEDETNISFEEKTRPIPHPFDPFVAPHEERRPLNEENEERVGEGKVVKIPDVAFVTFQAFLLYLYTNTIDFAPFGSRENRRSRSAEIVTLSDGDVPRPSPKSIYRLADKYDVPALKSLALNCIHNQLAKCDIVEEAFGRFASRYGEIRRLYIDYLAHAAMEDSTMSMTRAIVNKKVDSFVEGGLEHATEVICALWEIANKGGDIEPPANTSPAIAQVTSPAHWTAVKTALIKSIREGVFFDRKYWARNARSGDVLKPVYFSSIIMKDTSHQLDKLVKYLKGRNFVIDDLEGGSNIESDCEADPTGAEPETVEMTEGKEEEIRAVFIAGSFSAWKSLFFYRCTDAILFAPLKSQGIDPRLKYIHENTVAESPPPCSPKSIYLLAKLLGIHPLYESAFVDIKNKVSVDNVVDEVFSVFTASHNEIMEMECNLLMSNSEDPKVMALVKENIRNISGGPRSYCGDSLKLGLWKAFDLQKQKQNQKQQPPVVKLRWWKASDRKKRKRQPRGVKLRCPSGRCEWSTNYPPYSSIGSTLYCRTCKDSGWSIWYFECVGCGHVRSGSYASCQKCEKQFI